MCLLNVTGRVSLQHAAGFSQPRVHHGKEILQVICNRFEVYLPEILECHAVSGEADYLLRVVAADLKSFSDFLMHRLLRLPMVAHVRSSILLDEVKSTTALPLGRLG